MTELESRADVRRSSGACASEAHARELTILTYHSLETSGSVASTAPRAFADQVAHLTDLGVRGIALREAAAHRDATGLWPPRSVVLTFDDGYANFADEALPTLVRHGFTATVFLVTGHVGGRNDWAPPPNGLNVRTMLSWSQVAEIATTGIEIGAHTKTHPDLRRLSAAQVEDEIARSRLEIEHRLSQRVESFAYPYGRMSQTSRAIVQREFRAACTTVLKRVTREPLHQLPRVDMYYVRSPGDLTCVLNGEWDRYLALRRWGRSIGRLFRG